MAWYNNFFFFCGSKGNLVSLSDSFRFQLASGSPLLDSERDDGIESAYMLVFF